MPAGVTQGKFSIAAGRAENEMGNTGLFRNVNLDRGLVTEGDKRLLTTAGGPVNPEAFLSFVRRAVQGRWIETGRMTRAGVRGGPLDPPPPEPGDTNGRPPVVKPDVATPQAAPLAPNSNIKLPRSGR
jgi:hypothetical protein